MNSSGDPESVYPQQGYGPAVSDYYEPFPRMLLARPVVLAGQIGCGARLIARSLCARTGLPFVDIDRKIEHEAGASLDQIARDQSPARITRLARMMVERHATQRPWSVIVLDRAWPTLEVASLLRRKVDFVHIQRSPDFLLPRVRKELRIVGSWIRSGLTEELFDETHLKPFLDQRIPLLAQAGVLLDAGSQHELGVASILQESLEFVVHADAP